MFDLTGRVALVTGAGRNVGAGIVRALAERGAAVAVNDLVADRAKAVAEAIAAAGGRAAAVPFDVTDAEAAARGVERAREELGPVDILVNNAGVPAQMDVVPFAQMDPALWSKYVDLNLYGVLHCVKPVLDGMLSRGWGRIVTISSTGGLSGMPLGISLYGAGKAGAIGFSRHLAAEVAGTGVTVNLVALGLMTGDGDPDTIRELARGIPVGRLGQPEDAAAAVVYLASEEASWVTGQTVGVNGGSLMP